MTTLPLTACAASTFSRITHAVATTESTMMTFLPFADFKASAEALDTKRLQNQRTEARFVLEWLENRGFDLRAWVAELRR